MSKHVTHSSTDNRGGQRDPARPGTAGLQGAAACHWHSPGITGILHLSYAVNDDTALTVKILPIAEEHIEGFHRCLDAVARERRYLALVQAPPLESAREFVLSNIAQGVLQFVAVYGGEVIGWCDITPLKWDGFAHCGRLGIGVRADWRGRGIGRRLIGATLQRASEKGLERVDLEVFASNTPAIRLYESLGFVVEGIKRRGRKLDGAYDDVVEMVLFL
jgi:ribosomal protein S18 acetylase RimI-like enzyme